MVQENSTNDQPKREEGKLTRRSTLRSIGGGIALSSVPVTGLREEDKVRITTVKVGTRPREQKKVPKKWWTREQTAIAVQNKLRDRYGTRLPQQEGTAGINGIGLSTLDERISGRKVSSVKIYTDPQELGSVAFPNEMNGIPIETEETQFAEPNDCNTGDFDYVPGGVAVSGDKTGTSTCQVEYDGNSYIMTAYHLYGCGSSSPKGEKLHQSGQYVGDVETSDIVQDWVIVNHADNSQVDGFDDSIADQAGSVAGRVTKEGLLDLKSNDTPVYMQGKTRCEEDGKVTEVDKAVTTCHEWTGQHYVELSTPTDNGDSGAPHFHDYTFNQNRYLAIIAPHYGGESVGCAAYKIYDDHGITFNPS